MSCQFQYKAFKFSFLHGFDVLSEMKEMIRKLSVANEQMRQLSWKIYLKTEKAKFARGT